MPKLSFDNLKPKGTAKNIMRAGILAAAAFMTIGATDNWATKVTVEERAHSIGNPEANLILAEFVSYTCAHCANFTRTGEGPLKLLFIGQGTVKLEIRPVIRNGFDITLTMLAQCGEPDKFVQNHEMIMLRQKNWMPLAANSTQAQRSRWSNPDRAAGRRALTSDLGLYALMEGRGYRRTEVDQCLNDNAAAQKLLANSQADFAEFGIRGTPSFALNGKMLQNVHDWNSLSQVLTARISPPKSVKDDFSL